MTAFFHFFSLTLMGFFYSFFQPIEMGISVHKCTHSSFTFLCNNTGYIENNMAHAMKLKNFT